MNRLQELEVMLDAARAAAEIIAQVYASPFEVQYKGPADPVTEADRLANDLICARLSLHFPGVPIVAEESHESTYQGWQSAPRALFVDPLDGTMEFVARNDQFVVMIGLAEDGVAVAGALCAPVSRIAWVGAVGQGAFRVDPDNLRTPLKASPIGALAEARMVVSRSHRGPALTKLIESLAPRELVPYGSAGLKAALVAESKADVYVQPGRAGKKWDACGPQAIVEAAGGKVTDLWGHPMNYRGPSLDNESGIVMTNGLLHREVIDKIDRARPKP